MTLWKIDRATEKIAWQVFLQSSSFTISSIFIHFPTISSTLRTHKSSSNANIDPTPKKILMHFTCSWPMGKLPFEELDYWQRWRNHVMALSSQSKSPFFHSKNQILQPDIPHIYTLPWNNPIPPYFECTWSSKERPEAWKQNYRNRELQMDFLVD